MPRNGRQMREQAIAAQLPVKPLEIYGSDLYGDALKAAWRNLQEAGLSECVQLKQANVLEISAPAEHGVLVANLPYGERMGELDELGGAVPETGRRAEEEIRWLDCLSISPPTRPS